MALRFCINMNPFKKLIPLKQGAEDAGLRITYIDQVHQIPTYEPPSVILEARGRCFDVSIGPSSLHSSNTPSPKSFGNDRKLRTLSMCTKLLLYSV